MLNLIEINDFNYINFVMIHYAAVFESVTSSYIGHSLGEVGVAFLE